MNALEKKKRTLFRLSRANYGPSVCVLHFNAIQWQQTPKLAIWKDVIMPSYIPCGYMIDSISFFWLFAHATNPYLLLPGLLLKDIAPIYAHTVTILCIAIDWHRKRAEYKTHIVSSWTSTLIILYRFINTYFEWHFSFTWYVCPCPLHLAHCVHVYCRQKSNRHLSRYCCRCRPIRAHFNWFLEQNKWRKKKLAHKTMSKRTHEQLAQPVGKKTNFATTFETDFEMVRPNFEGNTRISKL